MANTGGVLPENCVRLPLDLWVDVSYISEAHRDWSSLSMSQQYLDEAQLEVLGVEVAELVLGIGGAGHQRRHLGVERQAPEQVAGATEAQDAYRSGTDRSSSMGEALPSLIW